ncbi:MAG: hypothetical protein ACTSRZ_19945, partial [Promethearchaeota archaeon]
MEELEQKAMELKDLAEQNYREGNYELAKQQFMELMKLYVKLDNNEGIEFCSEYIGKIKEVLKRSSESIYYNNLKGYEAELILELEREIGIPINELEPSNLGHVKINGAVTELYIDKNLTSFPVALCNFKELRKLKLRKINVSFIPEEIGNLTNLEVLELEDNNRPSSLPDAI